MFNSSDGSAVPYCVDRDETTYECLPNSEMKNITDWGITIDMAYRLYRVHIGSVSTLSGMTDPYSSKTYTILSGTYPMC